MITTSTVVIYTSIAPRWLAVLGFAVARNYPWEASIPTGASLVFPLWVFLISVYILRDSIRQPSRHPINVAHSHLRRLRTLRTGIRCASLR
jgi:hypothetical protein